MVPLPRTGRQPERFLAFAFPFSWTVDSNRITATASLSTPTFDPRSLEEMTQPDCPTHLIGDEPTVRSAFSGHDRIAELLGEIVENEDGGAAIAFNGEYGSGKSTVMGLLEERLKANDSNVDVFTFDAWSSGPSCWSARTTPRLPAHLRELQS